MQTDSVAREGEVQVRLSGDIGISQASRLHAELCDACLTDSRVAIDATSLEALDASCIQLLMAACKSQPNLSIGWGSSEGVSEVLKLTGATQLQRQCSV